MSNYEGGIGTFGTESVYWDMNKDGTTNVFPGVSLGLLRTTTTWSTRRLARLST